MKSNSSTPIHDQIDQWLDAQVGGGLSPSEAQALAQHLQECPACRQINEEYQTMKTLFENNLHTKKPAPDFEDRLVARFREEQPAFAVRERGAFLAWMARIGMAFLDSFRFPVVRYGGAFAGLVALVLVGALLTHETLLKGYTDADYSYGFQGRNTYTGGTTVSGGTVSIDNDSKNAMSAGAGRTDTLTALGREIDLPDASTTAPSPRFQAQEESKSEKRISGLLDCAPKSPAGGKPSDKAIDSFSAASAATSAPDAVGGLAALSTPLPDTRKIIRNAWATIEVPKWDDALTAIAAAARATGGFIDTKDAARGADGKIAGTVVVKIPAGRLDGFLSAIAPIGEIKDQKVAAEDVTKNYTDTESRLRNSQKMETRLLDLLDKSSGKVTDLLQVEKELGRVRSDIEQMQGQIKLYDSLIAYATVTLALAEKDLTHASTLKETDTATVLVPDVEKAFQTAIKVVRDAGGEVLHSDLTRDGSEQVRASVEAMAPPDTAPGLLTALKALGRVGNFRVEAGNHDAPAGEALTAPVRIELTLVDEAAPVQTTKVVLFHREVAARAAALKQAASETGAEVKTSTYERNPEGRENASLVFRLPFSRYPAFLEKIRSEGKVESFSEHREDRQETPAAVAENEASAPVEITLQIHNEGRAITDENSLGAVIWRTLRQGAQVFGWSLRMIGVAVAFLVPWAVALGVVLGGFLWLKKRRK